MTVPAVERMQRDTTIVQEALLVPETGRWHVRSQPTALNASLGPTVDTSC
jgi:hypothetical protein